MTASLIKKALHEHKQRIATRFAQAAQTYDTAASIQKIVAQNLANLVMRTPLATQPHVLEIGCGTGLLTSYLLPTRQPALWHLTDLSPELARISAQRMHLFQSVILARAMDGEAPDLPPSSVDLIVSNMAVQWFQDLETSIDRLYACLRPGGVLALTLPGSNTFTEWRTLCEKVGLPSMQPPGPPCKALIRRFPHALITRTIHTLPSQTVRAFLSYLRHIGAHTHPYMSQHISPQNMRRLVTKYGAQVLDTHYEILTLLWHKV